MGIALKELGRQSDFEFLEEVGKICPTCHQEMQERRTAPKPQIVFVERFQAAYQLKTGRPYKATKEDFIIAHRLLKEYGEDVCVEKAKILGLLCHRKSAWFTKDGWASFTVKTLSGQWNSIIPEADRLTKAEEKQNEEVEARRKVEADRERANSLLGRR